MSYQVLARKWRPGKFEDLVGQEHVVAALTSALENNRLHHAYLFTGTRGVGKTTIARILSKSLNCETQAGASPCGVCPTCQEIDQGRYVDLLEIDAASRTKVEDTRELLDNVQYKPTRGRYKVYLIDEVHMLSKHSFNALLKTLEEPPEHVKFLLATTDPQKLPVTILSRCLQFNLKALSREQISERLSYVLTQEDIGFEPDAIKHLARAAMGSLRDALSLTDQAIAQGGGQISRQVVVDMLGLMDKNQVLKLVNALVSRDKQNAFDLVEQFVEQAADLEQVLSEIASTLHQIALTQFVPDVCKLETLSPKGVYQLARQVSPEQIQLLYQIAIEGKRDIQWAPDPRTGLEMTLLRMLAFSPARALASAEPDALSAITPVATSSQIQAPNAETGPTTRLPSSEAEDVDVSEDDSESLVAMQMQQQEIEAQANMLGQRNNIDNSVSAPVPATSMPSQGSGPDRNTTDQADTHAVPVGTMPTEHPEHPEHPEHEPPVVGRESQAAPGGSTAALLALRRQLRSDASSDDSADSSHDGAQAGAPPVKKSEPNPENEVLGPQVTETIGNDPKSPEQGIARESSAEQGQERINPPELADAEPAVELPPWDLGEPAIGPAPEQTDSDYSAVEPSRAEDFGPATNESSIAIGESASAPPQSSAHVQVPSDVPPWPEQEMQAGSDVYAGLDDIASTEGSDDNIEVTVTLHPRLQDGSKLTQAAQIDDWSKLIVDSGVTAMTKQLALHSGFSKEGNAVTLTLPDSKGHLDTPAARVQLKDALGQVLGVDIDLTITLGVPTNTPFAIQQKVNGVRLEYANTQLAQDRGVELLKNHFSADIVKDSVQAR